MYKTMGQSWSLYTRDGKSGVPVFYIFVFSRSFTIIKHETSQEGLNIYSALCLVYEIYIIYNI